MLPGAMFPTAAMDCSEEYLLTQDFQKYSQTQTVKVRIHFHGRSMITDELTMIFHGANVGATIGTYADPGAIAFAYFEKHN